ncbi:LacI family DNA-binding transcriptional regulator [Sutcliffiella rhizosphaerae]|uniref:Catabolite control protein A n=1 Tax=Sutcliffiella rhizosphaerae TaxID=2880967 RepID=A0ABM8YT45_9BACI|nr:LacI family DNA-binding transcriptional regulator [Sutcliffiella rhizosphaerae]CAG9623198.1 Catabolite control protein A [Sutcliffiella rhizosphaerae]
MTITIKDIALKAGVSYSTVSKALNDSPLVKPITKNKILNIAKEMGYEPNFAAQRLVSKQSKVIGLIWPTLERIAHSTVVTQINEEISKNSYSMILSINSIKDSIEMFKRFQVDGIIVFDEKNQDALKDCSLPFVTYGVGKDKSFPVIDVNYQESMDITVKYLYSLGHRRIAYVGDFSPVDERQLEKYNAVRNSLNELGLPNTENMFHTGGLDWYDGYVATKRLLQSSFKPTAIIGSSYDISAGIIRALRESNIIIPKDISVISYDNIPQMANLEIPLTSVGVPIEEIAQCMVQTLLTIIQNKETTFIKTLKPIINERVSCAHVSIEVKR